MTLELRPLGVKCNLQCLYCYQNPQRDAGNLGRPYDIDRMKQAVERSNSAFTLFGGEALLIPEEDLEELWSWGFEKFGRNGIQTNGALISENHIRMFKAYHVHVGISVDGPGEFNDARWAGSLERTRQATAQTHAAIERLCRENIPCSLIVTLHRGNATAEKLPLMQDWFRGLERMGLKSARLHLLEVENEAVRRKYALTDQENIAALWSFFELEKTLKLLKFDIFTDLLNLLLGQDSAVTCIWNACDPYTTRAVQGIEGNGQRSNCGRSNKDGIDFVKADLESYERYLALYHTPQRYGGCKDCRFFIMCKGQCPGTALKGDWRNRTEHCEIWKALFERLEKMLAADAEPPISLREDRQQIEKIFIDSWASGQNMNIITALQRLGQVQVSTRNRPSHGDQHGDHTDHGEVIHGDGHGDHTDHGDSFHGDHQDAG
jgi:uncharacterized protein